jgi:low affinity Fe/Cu permease
MHSFLGLNQTSILLQNVSLKKINQMDELLAKLLKKRETQINTIWLKEETSLKILRTSKGK